MSTFEIPSNACPSCNYKMNRASSADNKDDEPQSGDLSMCVNCTEFLIFDDDLTQRLLTPDEFINLPIDVKQFLLKMRKIISGINQSLKRGVAVGALD